MSRFYAKFTVLLVLLTSHVVFAGGLEAAFTGSKLPNARSSMIFQHRGDTIYPGQDLVDVSGENLQQYSEAFENWTPARASIIINQYKNPLNGEKTADVLHEDNTPANNHIIYLRPDFLINHTYTLSLYVRPLNRQWIYVLSNDGVAYYGGYFQLTNSGTVGWLQPNTLDAKVQKINSEWYRISFRFVSAATVVGFFYIIPADNTPVDTYNGLDVDSLVIHGAQVVDNTDGYIQGPGIYHATTATTKPRLDMSANTYPIGIDSHLQDSNGNKLRARSYNGTTMAYARAHHDCMNVFDQDHTLTMVVRSDTSAVWGSEDTLFSHGAWGTAGVYVESIVGTRWLANYGAGGGVAIEVNSTGVETAVNDGMYKIVQIVRSSNTGTMYIDGVAGASVDVTGYGVDGNYTMYLGVYNGGAGNFWDGDILYDSLDNRALSSAELARDREEIRGYLSGPKQVNPAWYFERSTTAKQTYSTGGIRNVPVSIPRVGDGVLIEGQGTNIARYTEDFGPWSDWRSSTIVDTLVAPDGTTTADILHEDGTAASAHEIYYSSFNFTSGVAYRVSLYTYALNRDWVALDFYRAGPSYDDAWFDVGRGVIGTLDATWTDAKIEPAGDGYYRISATFIPTATAAHDMYISIGDSDTGRIFNGLDQDSLVIWGLQIEQNSFTTSYIGPVTTVNVARSADYLEMDPYTFDTNQIILPNIFSPIGPTSKITFEFEAKCEFSSSTNIGAYRHLFRINGVGPSGISVYINDTGHIFSEYADIDSVGHYAYTGADPVNFSDWFKVKGFFDFADLSRLNLWVNGSTAGMSYVGNTGTSSFVRTDRVMCVGSQCGSNYSFCEFRNFRVLPWEF